MITNFKIALYIPNLTHQAFNKAICGYINEFGQWGEFSEELNVF